MLLVTIFVLASYTPISFASVWSGSSGSSTSTPTSFAPAEIQNSWGAYTPYFPVNSYVSVPGRCTITQVNIIQRHGARFPTSGATDRIRGALQKLQSASSYSDPRLHFLRNYTYSLGVADLVPFGAYQSAEAGAQTYDRYRKLVSKGNIPFVRASGSDRVIDSATNWTAGFADASNSIFQPKLSLILAEHLNDTLENAMCPATGSSEVQTSIWAEIFGASVADRLNAQAPGANLTAADVASLIPLCPFESVALEGLSPFCALFTPQEFAHYEYLADLDKFYGTGYGQRLGPVQGVGYINELLARLTHAPVRDHTQTNRTLDAAPATFPLDRSIYADFSHDNLMVAVYAAMGLFRQAAPLDPTRPAPQRTWVTSRLVPFAGRMVVERVQCKDRYADGPSDVGSGLGSGSGYVAAMVKGKEKRKGDVFVRVLVNDAVQPLEFCGADADGLCALGRFVESQAYARNDGEGDFEQCYEDVPEE